MTGLDVNYLAGKLDRCRGALVGVGEVEDGDGWRSLLSQQIQKGETAEDKIAPQHRTGVGFGFALSANFAVKFSARNFLRTRLLLAYISSRINDWATSGGIPSRRRASGPPSSSTGSSWSNAGKSSRFQNKPMAISSPHS
jgi:hypothetical protein